MLTTNLAVQSHLSSANQGSEYFQSPLLRLHKALSRYLSLRIMHMDSASYRSGLFSILT